MHRIRIAPLLLLASLMFLLTACPESSGGSSGAPQITSFTANPPSIAAGTGSLLSWTVTGSPTSLTLSNSADSSVVAVTGANITVSPMVTTTYTLTATNSSGTDTETTQVTVGGTPTGEDGLPPSGSFGVSNAQSGPFENDAGGNITSASDPRVIDVSTNGGTFYAQVTYSDPGGVASVSIRLANSNPAGLAATLVPGQPVGGFTLGTELTGCILDGTQTAVSCVYPISVSADTPNIDQLTNSEFAYVFRTNVTDAAGNVSDQAIRGYVTVGGSNGGGGTPNPPTDPNPPTNPGPTAPTITSFSATPSSIGTDETSTLRWTISGTATEVKITPGDGRNLADDADKQITVSPDTPTTYTISAKNGSATAEPRTTRVTIDDGSGGGDDGDDGSGGGDDGDDGSGGGDDGDDGSGGGDDGDDGSGGGDDGDDGSGGGRTNAS